jgi:hypothetical protein
MPTREIEIMRYTLTCRILWASLVLSCGCAQPTPVPKQQESQYRPTSTIRELMQSVVAPSAQGIWDSVGTISNAKGTVNLEPRTDEEWAAVRRHAVALLESTNLLVMSGRHVAPAGSVVNKAEDAVPGSELPPDEIEKRIAANWPAFVGMAHALNDTGSLILQQVDKKSVSGLESVGSDLDAVCESCHLTFWYPAQPKTPN